ncbi:MAG: FKBP-type peptidyl-prolyl cis-trans isomerase [Treponema sp.]|jgi:FKBP-type peptidyl-prolyl cis-trans isomerase|nr:FKBP-type peptidyl-prolyl cis-trans isomerase [Treponema sp.]
MKQTLGVCRASRIGPQKTIKTNNCNRLLGVLLFLPILQAGAGEDSPGGAVPGGNADVSYAFGMVIGSDLKQTGLQFNYDAFNHGLREAMEGGQTRFSMDEAIRIMQSAYTEAMAEQAEINRREELVFLEQNGRKRGVTVTQSGLQYEVINEGSGRNPLEDDTVRVHYEGTFIDGTVFDSSYARGEPEEFPLDQVIPGWSEGLRLMKVGGIYRLYIASSLAYGAEGTGNIPPYATLVFEVELLAIVNRDSD